MFTAHYDYSRQLSINKKTYMAVNIYLNTVLEENKGATRVLKNEPHMGHYWNGRENLTVLAKIQPVIGAASIFRDTLWHDGEELLQGEKYLLRSDIVYQRESDFDFDKVHGDLPYVKQADKAVEIAYALQNGGAYEEVEEWLKHAEILRDRGFSI